MGGTLSHVEQKRKTLAQAVGASRAALLSDDEVLEVHDIYSQADENNDGVLDKDEYAKALKALGREDELNDDEDGDGVVDAFDQDGKSNVFKFDHDSVVRTTDGCLRFVGSRTRECTDPLCLLFFAAFWCGMIIIAVVAVNKGDPIKLIYGVDYNGTVCSQGVNINKDWLYYPNLEEELLAGALRSTLSLPNGVCLSECPKLNEKVTMDGKEWTVPYNTKGAFQYCFPEYPGYKMYLAQCYEYYNRTDVYGDYTRYTVSTDVTVSGYTSATFDTQAQLYFRRALGTSMTPAITVDKIEITAVVDVPSRRQLSLGSSLFNIDVSFAIQLDNEQTATDTVDVLAALKTDTSTFKSKWQDELVADSITPPAGFGVSSADVDITLRGGHPTRAPTPAPNISHTPIQLNGTGSIVIDGSFNGTFSGHMQALQAAHGKSGIAMQGEFDGELHGLYSGKLGRALLERLLGNNDKTTAQARFMDDFSRRLSLRSLASSTDADAASAASAAATLDSASCGDYASTWEFDAAIKCTTQDDFMPVSCTGKSGVVGGYTAPSKVTKACQEEVAKRYPHCKRFSQAEATFTSAPTVKNPVLTALLESSNLVSRYVADIFIAVVPILLCGGLLSAVQGFVFLQILEFATGFMVYASLVIVVKSFEEIIYTCPGRHDLFCTTLAPGARAWHRVPIHAGRVHRHRHGPQPHGLQPGLRHREPRRSGCARIGGKAKPCNT